MKANYNLKQLEPKENEILKDGQIVRKEDGFYVYRDNEFYPIDAGGIDTGMSLYDLNKQGYA